MGMDSDQDRLIHVQDAADLLNIEVGTVFALSDSGFFPIEHDMVSVRAVKSVQNTFHDFRRFTVGSFGWRVGIEAVSGGTSDVADAVSQDERYLLYRKQIAGLSPPLDPSRRA